jgi:hypothetical protein
MPRLTGRVFTDLAIWMIAFGLLIGVVVPSFCLALGLPADRILTPIFLASTLGAGLAVGAVNHALARLVVGRLCRRGRRQRGSLQPAHPDAVMRQAVRARILLGRHLRPGCQ